MDRSNERFAKAKTRRNRTSQRDEKYKNQFRTDDKIDSQDLIGCIYMIKEEIWGFNFSNRKGHPGACLNVTEELNYASLVQGTDANSYTAKRLRKISYIVKPSNQNNLKKTVAFILDHYEMRLRKLMLYHFDRRIGRLDDEDLLAMKMRIARSRLHPNPWEDNL